MNIINVKAVVLDPKCTPRYAKDGDGAFDIRARIKEGFWLNPSTRQIVPVGIRLAIPSGFGGFVIPRSGLASKSGITVTNSPGLCDSGFRGEVCVIVQNDGHQAVRIEPYDRIAQYVIVPVMYARFEFVDELDETERGGGGFGSTGVC